MAAGIGYRRQPMPGLEHMVLGPVLGGCTCLLAALLTYLLGYRRSARRHEAIAQVPTVAARDLAGLGASLVEVKGLAEADVPLLSDLARIPCVAFTSRVTEHWTSIRTEHDSKGRTRTVIEHHSETRYANEGRIEFRVRDATGAAVVRPAGAEIEMLDAMSVRHGPHPDSPAAALVPHHFGGRLRYEEVVFPTGSQTYVLGEVGPDHAITHPTVLDRPFLISYRSEEALRRRAAWGCRVFGILTVLFKLAGFVLLGVGLPPGGSGSISNRPAGTGPAAPRGF